MVRCIAVTVNVVAVTKSTHQHRSLGYSREAAAAPAHPCARGTCTSMCFETRGTQCRRPLLHIHGLRNPDVVTVVTVCPRRGRDADFTDAQYPLHCRFLCLLIAAIALALHRRAQLRHLALCIWWIALT